jgi:hypothetical protein
MELAVHWHRCQNLPKKRVNTSQLYRERDDPVKDGLANGCGSFFCTTGKSLQRNCVGQLSTFGPGCKIDIEK